MFGRLPAAHQARPGGPPIAVVAEPDGAGFLIRSRTKWISWPLVNTPVLEQAATAVGFAQVDEWSMPNGRVVRMWTRPCPSPMSAKP